MSDFPTDKLTAIIRAECKKGPGQRKSPLVVEGMLDATTLAHNPDIYDDPDAYNAYDDYKQLLLVKLAHSPMRPRSRTGKRSKTRRSKTRRSKSKARRSKSRSKSRSRI